MDGESVHRHIALLLSVERAMGALLLSHKGIEVAMDGLAAALEADEDLQPELAASAEALREASDAVVRCLDFMRARIDVSMQQFGEEDTTGG